MNDTPRDVQVIRTGAEQGRGGLYNMIVPGGFERAGLLLPIVGINPHSGPMFRLRDAWVETSPLTGLSVHVFTRVGGGNRGDYAEIIELLRNTPGYLRDADDSFDSTYASFWFRVPDRHIAELAEFAVAPVDTGQRWKDMIGNLQAGGRA